MQRSFDQDFSALKTLILAMGAKVEKAVEFAIQGLVERDLKILAKVHELEKEINQAHVEVDETCLKVLARQSPLASNLRLVFSIIKINADLERMGDQAKNIAYNSKDYINETPVKPLIDIPKMSTEVKIIVRSAMEAFINQDMALARKVLAQDEVIDGYKDKILEELCEYMSLNPTSIKPTLNLILIARNLERLGDHATNIAEEAIFDASGKDIRHQVRPTE